MNKKLILGIFLMVAMLIASSSVLAVPSVTINNTYVQPGVSGIVAGQINITNTGAEDASVSLQFANLAGPTGTNFQVSNISSITNPIGPGALRTVNFNINLGNSYAGTYTGIVYAIPNGGVSVSAPITAEVLYNGLGLNVTSFLYNTTQTDSIVNQVITVQNLGNRDSVASITPSDYARFTFTVDKTGSYIFPAFSTTNVMSTVVIPAGTPSNTYSGKVIITADPKTYQTTLQTFVQSTTKVSVPAITISVDPGSSASGSVVISNTGNTNLNGLSISNLPVISDSNGNTINFTATPNSSISVDMGSTASVGILARASPKMLSGDYTATLTLKGGSINTPFNVNVHVNDLLTISSIDINKDEFKPGDDIKITVEVENIAEDIDLKSVQIKAYLLDNSGNKLQDDNGDSIELESDTYTVSAGNTKKFTFDTVMPYDVSDGDDITVKIVATGKNADDSSQKFTVTDVSNTITVNREDDKLQIYQAALDSDTLSCSRSTYLNVGVRDIGNSDEDSVELAVTNTELGIDNHDIFDMNSNPDDDNFEVQKSYLLDLEDAKKGTYNIKVTVYYSDNKKSEQMIVPVTITDCSTSSSSSTSTGSASGTSTGASSGTASTGTGSAGTTGSATGSTFTYTGGTGSSLPAVTASSAVAPKIVNTKDNSGNWTDNIGFLVLVGIANILLIAVIVVAIMYVRK
ncbi:MAG: hypothetical protein NT001_04030 [Candidatus Woesearchaeota archaeon]|nr:hypothetical protein [Candidatus Woesearchaeota archaeon]